MKMSSKTALLAFAFATPAMLSGCATVEETVAEAIADTQRATLTGAEIVSSSGDRDGYARAEVSIANELDQICYDINDIRNLATITSISINRGMRGQTGPSVLRFEKPNEGGWKGCVKRSEWLEDKLEFQPGNYYVQVSTTEFPNGAVRGQLSR